MKSRPILFSAPMVRAILEGSKTQTRRVVMPQPKNGWLFESPPVFGRITSTHSKRGKFGAFIKRGVGTEFPECDLIVSPYGKPGDQLWVKETWQYFDWTEDGEPCIAYAADNSTAWPSLPADEEQVMKIEDAWANLSEPKNYLINNRASDKKWRPSIFMPRWASRITLEITGVRVERLQDISEADAIAEGVKRSQRAVSPSAAVSCYWDYLRNEPQYTDPRSSYSSLWESINGPGSWDTNPWVWVIEFKRIAP